MWAEQHRMATVAASRDGGAPPTTRLLIPKIGLDDMVVHGTDYRDLLGGPGLLAGSPEPGEPGNSVIAGHRDTFFRHVVDLAPGDTILVGRMGHEFKFVVQTKQIVKPTLTAVLQSTPASRRTPELTLVTCYPTYWIGPAPKRLIVTARESSTP